MTGRPTRGVARPDTDWQQAIDEFKKQVLAIHAETGLPVEEIMQGLLDALELEVERRGQEES